jgi:signal transduction histidine kinase
MLFLAVLVAAVSALATWAVVWLVGVPNATSSRLAVAAIAGLAACAAVVAGVRRMSAPVGDLIVALGRVADGDYETRVREHGAREVRTLARAFNRMTERLQRQEAQRRDLLTDISHELRTPLAVLQGNLEGMLDGVYTRDAEHLSLVLEETQVLARLIEDLRTLTLSESLELALARTPTDLGAIARDALASFEAQAAEAGVALRLERDATLPAAEVDPERMRQVLNNLVSNALRYTPAGGAIVIRCAPGAPGSLIVSVEDTGAGIPAERLPHVFDRFYKSVDSRGTGLGLAIAKSLVQAHGGTIAAESAPGKGTTIRITLPLRPEA